MNIKGHSLTLIQGHSDSTYSSFFSLKTARSVEAKFHVEPPWDWGTKVNKNGQRHTHTFMIKTLKNILLWNQKADDLESWYEALGT